MLHRKTLKTQKTFFGFKSSIAVILWGFVAIIKRIISIIGFFTPSLGLFNILYHHLAEQYPYTIRKKYHPLPIDDINIFNMTEKIRWSVLDRSRYELPEDPAPPSYRMYTGFDLKYTLAIFFLIMAFQCLSMFLVKYFTSKEFQQKGSMYNKLMHILQCLNISYPYVDWDDGNYSIEVFKQRFKSTEREMLWSCGVNSMFCLLMLIPIWYTGKIF